MRFGLICFIIQCVLISLASQPWHIFGCVLLSTATNLVYPSLTSLVTSHVSENKIGESLGAVNGIKSLTEGEKTESGDARKCFNTKSLF